MHLHLCGEGKWASQAMGNHVRLLIMYFKTPAQYKNVQSVQCHRLSVLRHNFQERILKNQKKKTEEKEYLNYSKVLQEDSFKAG